MRAVLIAGAYLLGSIPFGYFVLKFLSGVDIRSVGSGNIGATNVLRSAGLGPAAVVFCLDFLKGFLPVAVARIGGEPESFLGLVALASVAGHVYPVFLRFEGGKGVATAVGSFAAMAWRPTLASVLVFSAVLVWKRYVSLASIAAVGVFPVILLLDPSRDWPLPVLICALAVGFLVLYRHRLNAARLVRGEEPRIGERVEAEVS